MRLLNARLTALLESIRAEFSLPGVDCAVWHHHRPVFRYMSGVEDIGTNEPVTENTLYHLYSNTKVITCVAAMQLYERGLFLLEDRLERYFPEFSGISVLQSDGSVKYAERPVTIENLFCMTAGIGDGADYAELGKRFYTQTGGECPLSRLPEYLAQAPLLFEPGTQFRYGICHELLAALIEKLSGERFGAYLKKHIFEPLGMNNTAFSPEECESSCIATQYTLQKDRTLISHGKANCLIPPVLKESASGGLIGSVDDYMKFLEALARGNSLLSRRTIELMRLDRIRKNRIPGYGSELTGMGYGLGVRTVYDQAESGGPTGLDPFGWGGATGSYSSVDPENEICIFYMQSVFGTEEARTHKRIRNVVYSCLS